MAPDPTTPSGFGLGRRQLRAAVAFAVFALVTLVVVNVARFTFLVPRSSLRGTLGLYSYRTLEEPYDVVMVGSSRIDYSIDARIAAATLEEELGEPASVYKLAQHGLRPWLLYAILRDLVADRPPRRLLVVGMGLQFFNNQGLEARALRHVGSLRDVASIRPAEMSPIQWRAYFQLPFRGLQVMWNLDWALSPATLAMRDYQRLHGGELSAELDAALVRAEQFELVRRMVSTERYDVITAIPDERLEIEPFEESRPSVVYDFDDYWFGKVLDLLEEMPCEVVLVRTPVKNQFLDSITDETRREFEETVVPDIRRRGLGYANLNREPYPRLDRYFRDVVHMTAEGRQITSETIAREILAPRLR